VVEELVLGGGDEVGGVCVVRALWVVGLVVCEEGCCCGEVS